MCYSGKCIYEESYTGECIKPDGVPCPEDLVLEKERCGNERCIYWDKTIDGYCREYLNFKHCDKFEIYEEE